jgi:hypothetical protein
MGGQLWAKIALNLADNPKVIGLSDSAFRAFVEAILYSRQHLTDGFLDARVVAKRWGLDVAAELTSNDPQNPSWVPVEGGFQLHNFCEYQTTTDDLDEIRERKSRAGKASAEARKQRKLNENSTEVQQPVEVVLNTIQPETETETETETYKANTSSPAEAGKPNRKTKLDPQWKPNDDLRGWTQKLAPSLDIEFETGRFIDWFAQTGKAYGDWDATWRNWVRRSVEQNPALKIQPPPPKKQFTGDKYDDI